MASKIGVLFLLLLSPLLSFSQNKEDTSIRQVNIAPLVISSGKAIDSLLDYRSTVTQINDLVHTRLQLRFNFDSCFAYGEAWVTLTPHFYPSDSLTLDAKGMTIHAVELIVGKHKNPLNYTYDGMQLHIQLNKTYYHKERYTIYIKYTAKPNKYAAKHSGGSTSVTSDKGLFFIDPHHTDPYKPTEIWSMGYPESNSVWFPTIDKPNQKSTQEITLTIPDTLTSFSNGLLVLQKENADGTRSDTWKTAHPNAPYLFTIAVGSFEVIRDHYQHIPIVYFVEKKYAPYAEDVFGNTPEMMHYFSKILRTPYPWKSYKQIVVRDFITGAMENTTASMFGESLYKTKRQLEDDSYRNESIIAHELFHQWFGNLVTCESWSNIALNESFADYSEMLWAEHKYGTDMAAQHNYKAMQRYFYFAATHPDHPLVYSYYSDKNEVLDAVSYQKGGRILNLLRNYVGDSAFFASLHCYLTENKYQSAEAAQLRLAFEKITGKDLRLFWRQWFHRPGYPKLDIRYQYNDSLKIAKVFIAQTQKGSVYMLPFAIDVYEHGKKHRYKIKMRNRTYVFSYKYNEKPDLINVDGDHVLLAKIKDQKTLHNYIYQYRYAGKYMDRRLAIEACKKLQDSSKPARQLLLTALKDRFFGLRKLAIQSIDLKNEQIKKLAFPILKQLLHADAHSSVRAAALIALTKLNPDQYKTTILRALQDSSLQVKSTALSILNDIAPKEAYQHAQKLQLLAEAPLSQTICTIYAQHGYPTDFQYIKQQIHQTGSFGKFQYLPPYFKMLGNTITQDTTIHQELQYIKNYAKIIGPGYGYYIIGMLNNFIQEKKAIASMAKTTFQQNKLREQADYGKMIIREITGMLE